MDDKKLELNDQDLALVSGGTDDTTPPPEAVADGLYVGAIVAAKRSGCQCGNNRFQVTDLGAVLFTSACTQCGHLVGAPYTAFGGSGWTLIE